MIRTKFHLSTNGELDDGFAQKVLNLSSKKSDPQDPRFTDPEKTILETKPEASPFHWLIRLQWW